MDPGWGKKSTDLKYIHPRNSGRNKNFKSLDKVLRNIILLLSYLCFDHDGVEELLHTVRVPLADGKLLRHLLIFIKQLNSFMN